MVIFSIKEWQLLITSSEDIRRDLLEKESIKKVFGDVSNLMRGYSNQVFIELRIKSELEVCFQSAEG